MGGRWVAVVAEGVRWGEGPRTTAELPIAGARFACFDAQGERFAVVAENETFRVVAPDGTASPTQALGAAPTGLSRSRLGWWIVSTAQGVVRIATDGAPPQLYLRWSGKDSPTNVVCSEGGRLCAFSAGQRAVALFGVEEDVNCGASLWLDRQVGELEFGPRSWLGVGLGLGDGNKIDVGTGACHRTDPPDDRLRNRWMLQVGFDPDAIARVLPNPAPSKGRPARATATASHGVGSLLREFGLIALVLIAVVMAIFTYLALQ